MKIRKIIGTTLCFTSLAIFLLLGDFDIWIVLLYVMVFIPIIFDIIKYLYKYLGNKMGK